MHIDGYETIVFTIDTIGCFDLWIRDRGYYHETKKKQTSFAWLDVLNSLQETHICTFPMDNIFQSPKNELKSIYSVESKCFAEKVAIKLNFRVALKSIGQKIKTVAKKIWHIINRFPPTHEQGNMCYKRACITTYQFESTFRIKMAWS